MDKKKTKNKNHNKKKYTASNQLAKFRGWIQAGATLLTNIHLPNFFKGEIYQGKGKAVCVPGLNCYSWKDFFCETIYVANKCKKSDERYG